MGWEVVEEKKGNEVKLHTKKYKKGRALVAHACNPSYSGGRD
jgi:hypothetical protein